MESVIPAAIRPMLAETSRPFDSPDHLFEVKWDGLRCLAFVGATGRPVHLQSRNLLSLDPHYPDLMGLDRQIKGAPCVLDGEIIALRQGRPSFLELQKRMNAVGRGLARAVEEVPVLYVVFDILYRKGAALMERPLRERRAVLEETVKAGDRLLISETIAHNGRALYNAACERRLEGIMAKRIESRYLPGRRSEDWLKIKRLLRQAFAVCGYYGGVSSRGPVSSLLVGSHYDGALRGFGFVGSGLTDRDLDLLARELPALECASPPGPDFPTGGRKVHWVKPVIVCLVEYLELTEARTLRHPTFRGFCPDLTVDECVYVEDGLFDLNGRCVPK